MAATANLKHNPLERRRPTIVSAMSAFRQPHPMAASTFLPRLLPKPPQSPPYCGRDVDMAIGRVSARFVHTQYDESRRREFPAVSQTMQANSMVETTSLSWLLPKPPQSPPYCGRDVAPAIEFI